MSHLNAVSSRTPHLHVCETTVNLDRVSSEELSTHLLILHLDIFMYILYWNILDPVFWNL
jgi:hypothetical protein